MSDEQDVRRAPFLPCILTCLAASANAYSLLNAAQVQTAALITLNAAPQTHLFFDVGGWLIIAGLLSPVLTLALAIRRRWTLTYFIGWLLVTVLVGLLAANVGTFAAFSYWRDHQSVGASVQVSPWIS